MSISEVAQSLDHACVAIEAATGVNMRRGRLLRYLELLQRASPGSDVNQVDLWRAALESSDVQAASVLRPEAFRNVRHRLGALTAGPDVPDGEHDPGRDLAFEFATAALLHAVDPHVSLGVQGDVSFTADGQAFFVECKRPSTGPALGRSIKKAFEQFSELRRSGHAGFGMVAIDLSLLAIPANKVVVGRSADDVIESLFARVRRCLDNYQAELARAQRNVRKDANVHVILFRLLCPVGVESWPPAVGRIWHAEPLLGLESAEFQCIYKALSRVPAFDPRVHLDSPNDSRAGPPKG